MIKKIPVWERKEVVFQGKNAFVNMNPVMWGAADFEGHGDTPSFENLFEFLTHGIVGDENGLRYAILQYKKLREKVENILPADFSELAGVAKLLNVATSDFVIRNSIGTISACGMIGEIITNFLFKVWNETLQNPPLTESEQNRLFGKKFEDLIQKRRTEVLFELGIIDSATKSFFDNIRGIRNDYIHITANLENIDKNAIEIFELVNNMFNRVFQMKIENKKIWMNKHIADYLINSNKMS